MTLKFEKKALVTIVGSMMLVSPALASHAVPHESGWFEYQYNDDDTRVLHCTALGALGAGLYLHDRVDSEGVTGLGPEPMYTRGGGTWIYQEANGISGAQIGGGGIGIDGSGHDPLSTDCLDGDAVVAGVWELSV